MTPDPPEVARARRALELATADPGEGARAARQLLDDPAVTHPAARATAVGGRGLVERERGDLRAAHARLEDALEIAAGAGAARRELAAEIRSSLAWVTAQEGDLDAALAAADQAMPHLRGVAAARNRYQRALVRQRMGHHDEALRDYAAAEAVLDRHGDRVGLARLLINRSVLHTYAGRTDAATADLESALAHSTAADQSLLAALCAANLGFTAGRAGDVPAALAWFDRADEALARVGRPPDRQASLELDRAEVLLTAGLLEEALDAAAAAVTALRVGDNRIDLGEALVAQARIAAIAGQPAEAAALAREAVTLFEAQHRDAWAAQARFVAATSGHDDTPREELAALGTDLLDQGWAIEGRQMLLHAARGFLDAGDSARAQRVMRPLLVQEGQAPAVLRAQAWHAAALAERAAGRPAAARGAVRAGLATIDAHRLTLGSAELRAHATRHAADLVGVWLHMALTADRPWEVVRAVEAWRSRSLDFPAARPPDDAELAALLTDLRTVEGELRAATAAREPTGGLLARRRDLEARVRRADRRTGATTRAAGGGLDLRALRAASAARTFVQYVVVDGILHAVVITGGSARLRGLGPVRPLRAAVVRAIAGLHRLASSQGSTAGRGHAEGGLVDALAALDGALVAPLGLPAGPVVVVPTGDLHRIPWGALPGVRGRPLTVTPSLRLWLRASAGRPTVTAAADTALVLGPDLAGAAVEIEALAERYPNAQVLRGDDATIDHVLRALDGAQLAHLAAHGTFRHDNPLFSALRMVDGSLTVHDLARVATPPRIVVMPSCDTAVSETLEGDELLGLAAALLRLGVSSLVAPVVPIPDEAAAPLVVALHDRLLAGDEPAAALATATAEAPGDSPHARAVRQAFIALGS